MTNLNLRSLKASWLSRYVRFLRNIQCRMIRIGWHARYSSTSAAFQLFREWTSCRFGNRFQTKSGTESSLTRTVLRIRLSFHTYLYLYQDIPRVYLSSRMINEKNIRYKWFFKHIDDYLINLSLIIIYRLYCTGSTANFYLLNLKKK